MNLMLKDIKVSPERGRKTFTRMGELADSIKRYGLIHPIVVSPIKDQEGKFDLVAGERRFRGAIMAGLAKVPVVLRTDSELILAEIELEENACRSDLSFEEEGNILRKIQEIKRLQNPESGHGMRDIAEMTNRSLGDVQGKIAIAKKFEERPELKEVCKGMPYTVALKKIDQVEEAEKVERMSAQGLLTMTTDLRHGDCRELIKELADGSIDVLVTDPPYGLAKLEDLRKPGSEKMVGHQLMSESHNQDINEVRLLLCTLAPQLYRVMKPGAHFYMFTAFQYIGIFVEALEPHLEFKPPVLIWDRGKSTTIGMGYNYLSRAEVIIYGHKPPQGRRLTENMFNIFEFKDVPNSLRIYPTEKPVELLQTFIKNSTPMNAVVLDPFTGSGSTLVAARRCGRRGIGFEVDREAFLRAQKRLSEEET